MFSLCLLIGTYTQRHTFYLLNLSSLCWNVQPFKHPMWLDLTCRVSELEKCWKKGGKYLIFSWMYYLVSLLNKWEKKVLKCRLNWKQLNRWWKSHLELSMWHFHLVCNMSWKFNEKEIHSLRAFLFDSWNTVEMYWNKMERIIAFLQWRTAFNHIFDR